MRGRDIPSYAADYAAAYGFEKVMVRMRRRLILEKIQVRGARRILEVGCGLESLAGHLTEFEKLDVVEPSREFLRGMFIPEAVRPRVEVHEGTLEEKMPQLKGRKFDYIVVSSLLHEVPKPLELARAVACLMGAGTRAHFNVPNARSLHRRVAKGMGLLPSWESLSPRASQLQTSCIYDLPGLRNMVESAGMRVVEEGGYFLKPFTHNQMLRMLEEGIIDDAVLDGLYAAGVELPEAASEIHVETETIL